MNLEFDEAKHHYSLNGRRLISVTQALSILSQDRWRVDPWYLQRGRLIHLATELYDRDELDESTLDPQIVSYLDAYVKFGNDTDYAVDWTEKKLYHPQYYYAGRIDRIGELNGDEIILDIKSGAKADVDELQGAAYWELCRANNIPIKKVFDLYLHDNGTYSLREIEKPKLLLPTFLACLTLTRWKEKL